jgi:prepilin-type N-terminal cleavage/methylation domain-containing protein
MLNDTQTKTQSRRRRDAGMTLPELLIVISVMGILTTVIAATITVTFRTVDASEGRVNVARAEQSIDRWLPADLTSTDVTDIALPAVDITPSASPCGNCGALDLSGVNALQLAWKTSIAGSPPIVVITRVQYQYIQVGTEWQIQRIACVGAQSCSMNIVLHELKAPPDPAAFNPDTDRPVCVMDVAAPNDPAALNRGAPGQPPVFPGIRVPDAILEFTTTGSDNTSITIIGYIAVPQGRVEIGAADPSSTSISMLGGFVAGDMWLDPAGVPSNLVVEFDNPIAQKTVRLNSTVTGRYNAMSQAIVQVNKSGSIAINSWLVQ